MTKGNILARIKALNIEISDDSITSTQAQDLEQLDRLRVQHLVVAHSKYRNPEMGEVP
jgi:hypothetical protein